MAALVAAATASPGPPPQTATALPKAKHDAFTARLLEICGAGDAGGVGVGSSSGVGSGGSGCSGSGSGAAARSEAAEEQQRRALLFFVRDRLHERFELFRAFPPRLQAMVCRLAVARRWARNEVVVGAGARPTHLYFIVEGAFAVAVRRDGGSALIDAGGGALLGPGASFGELALITASGGGGGGGSGAGPVAAAARSPAFVVARTPGAATISVDARRLAALMEAEGF